MSQNEYKKIHSYLSFYDSEISFSTNLNKMIYDKDYIDSQVTDYGASAYLYNASNTISISELKDDQVILSLYDVARLLGMLKEYYEGDKYSIIQTVEFSSLKNSVFSLSFYDNYSSHISTKMNMTLGGVLDPKYFDASKNENHLLFSPSFVENLVESSSFPYEIYFQKGDKNSLSSLINPLLENDFYVSSSFMPYTETLSVAASLGNMAKIFLLISVLLLVIIAIIIYLYINQSIKLRGKEIAIYKAIGAKKLDIDKIFVFEAVFIALFSSLFSIILGLILNQIANITISSSYSYLSTTGIGILNLSWYILPVVIIIILFLTIISSLLPIIRLNRQKAITTIKEAK